MTAETPGAVGRPVRDRHLLRLAVTGTAASLLVVGAGGRVGPPKGAQPLTHWLGIVSYDTVDPDRNLWPGALLTVGIVGLVVTWLFAVRAVLRERWGVRRIWLLGICWALPLAVGPPLLSSDVYTYAAQGLMVKRGLDPYSNGPAILGAIRAVRATDPTWRSTPSPYGPLATLVEHLAVNLGGNSPLGAVIVFRLLAVGSVIAIGMLAVRLVPADAAGLVLVITALNPLLLLHVLAPAHFEGLLCAAMLAAFVSQRRGHNRLALAFGCVAAAIKAPAIMVILVLAVTARHGQRRRVAVEEAAVTVGMLAVFGLFLTLTLPNAWGWVQALETPTQGRTAAAPAALISDLLSRVVPVAATDDVATAGRIAALALAGCIVLYLVTTSDRRPPMATAGQGLLAVAVLGPIVYPWYLLWGLICLAAPIVTAACVSPSPRHRAPWPLYLLVATSAFGAVSKLLGLTTALNVIVTLAALAATGLLLVAAPRFFAPGAAPVAA